MVLLTPKGDKINAKRFDVPVYEGPEHDVLTRYYEAMEEFDADYVVRITSDCPHLPSDLITKHIFTAVNHQLDYMTNTYPKARTYPDGFDVEVVSARLLDWLNETADHIKYREHVTNLLHEHTPDWCKRGTCLSYVDNEHLKLSIDTKEDYDFSGMYIEYGQKKMDWAKNNCMMVTRW